MNLPRAEASLHRLTEYLWETSDVPRSLLNSIALVHSYFQDSENSRKARRFCHVTEGSTVIRCAANIENVSERVRLGLLLHEIGHLALHAFHSDEPDYDDVEVRVDSWCQEEVPEARYQLAHHKYTAITGRKRTAKSVQHVSANFVRTLAADIDD